VPALLDDLLELVAERFEIRKLAFDFGEMQACDAIDFGARPGAIVGEAQQFPHFLEGKPEIAAAPDKAQPLEVRFGITAVVAAAAGNGGQKANAFVLADRLDLGAGALGEVTDAEAAAHLDPLVTRGFI
jgi:hypothetical protein